MKRYIFVAVGVFALIIAHCVGASEQAGDANSLMKLEDYLTSAALNNPGLKAAFEQWKVAVEQVPQAKSLPDPKFTYGYFIEEVETRVGPQRNRLEIMQMFPWCKLKLKGNAAAEAANAEKQKYENIKLILFYRVKEAYYDYYYITRRITILKENVQLLEHLERKRIEAEKKGEEVMK